MHEVLETVTQADFSKVNAVMQEGLDAVQPMK